MICDHVIFCYFKMPSLPDWFSLNRVDGGPAYFSTANRSSAPIHCNDWFYGVIVFVVASITISALLLPAFKRKCKTFFLVIIPCTYRFRLTTSDFHIDR